VSNFVHHIEGYDDASPEVIARANAELEPRGLTIKPTVSGSLVVYPINSGGASASEPAQPARKFPRDWDSWFASLPLIQRARSWANAAAALIGEGRTRALAMAQTLRERLKTEELLSDPVAPAEAETPSAQAAYMDAIARGDSEAASEATQEIVRQRRSAAGVTRPEMQKSITVDSFAGLSGDADLMLRGKPFQTKKCVACGEKFTTRSERQRCNDCAGSK